MHIAALALLNVFNILLVRLRWIII